MRMMILVAALASLAGLAYCTLPFLSYKEELVGGHLAGRVAVLDDANAAALVKGIPLDEELGLRSLAELAISPRQSVAQAAQQRLDDWLETLCRRAGDDSIDPDATGRLVYAVADELALHKDTIDGGAAEWAARLARRFVGTAAFVSVRERLGFLERCDIILAAGSGDAPRRRIAGAVASDRLAASDNLASSSLETVEDRLMEIALQRGPSPGDSPSRALAADAPVDHARENMGVMRDTGVRNRTDMEATTTTRPIAFSGPTAVGPGIAWRTPRDEPPARVRADGPAAGETIDVPSPDVAHAREQELLHAPLEEVIAALASEDRFESAIAESALRIRGMSPVDLDIARRLPDADAAARLQLLDEVAGRSGARLAAWLQHFAVDEAADVRLRALGLLATSRDEAVVEGVYAQAIRDDDPRVRALAQRIREAGTPPQ